MILFFLKINLLFTDPVPVHVIKLSLGTFILHVQVVLVDSITVTGYGTRVQVHIYVVPVQLDPVLSYGELNIKPCLN